MRIKGNTIGYHILYAWASFFHNKIFYRKIIVRGKENIPKNSPVIFAPNHQNALMDPLAILFTSSKTIMFLARADIFKKKFIAYILRGLNILPVYRLRDGSENLIKNDDTFSQSIEILENNKALALFPEAKHNDKRSLLGLKKGLSRIVFMAEEKHDFQLDVQIVPVGIYYSNYTNFRTILEVNYGKPINVSEYKELYKENPQRALSLHRDSLTDQIRPLMIDIQNADYYDSFDAIRNIYNHNMVENMGLKRFRQKHRFLADKKIIEILDDFTDRNPEEMKEIHEKTQKYEEGLKKHRLRDWIFRKDNYSIFSFILIYLEYLILFPLHLYGVVFNVLPYKISQWIVESKIKDKQFHSSIKYGIALILFPLFHWIFFFIFYALFPDPWYAKWIFLVSQTLMGLFSFTYMISHRKTNARLRYTQKLNAGNKEILQMQKIRKEIIAFMDDLVKEYTGKTAKSPRHSAFNLDFDTRQAFKG